MILFTRGGVVSNFSGGVSNFFGGRRVVSNFSGGCGLPIFRGGELGLQFFGGEGVWSPIFFGGCL